MDSNARDFHKSLWGSPTKIYKSDEEPCQKKLTLNYVMYEICNTETIILDPEWTNFKKINDVIDEVNTAFHNSLALLYQNGLWKFIVAEPFGSKTLNNSEFKKLMVLFRPIYHHIWSEEEFIALIKYKFL